MSKPVICFSGRIGSGKTTVSHCVARSPGWKWASFGQFVHTNNKRIGGSHRRSDLQDSGQLAVNRNSFGFCNQMLTHFSVGKDDNVIIDGIRHLNVLNDLKKIFSSRKVILLYLGISNSIREARLTQRGDDRREIAEAEQHCMEQEVIEDLPRVADRIVNVDGELTDTVSVVRSVIDSFRYR